MGLTSDITGTSNDDFKVGLSGPRVKNESGSLGVRNAGDTDYVPARVGSPVGDNDAVNKLYFDQTKNFPIVSRQASGASLPTNTTVEGMVVVTTTGGTASIGDCFWDNGLNTGNTTILTATKNRSIAVSVALSGGTISFDADSMYTWDDNGSSWVKIGDIGSVTGAIRVIRKVIDNSASQDSTTTMPAFARAFKTRLEITTPYSGGATIELRTVAGTVLMATTQNNPQSAATYETNMDTSVGAVATGLRAVVSGSPAAGAGVITAWFNTPNA